ncbi:MAG: hypothetical protein ACFFD2_25815 [Promethearchaeota archaeon]
MPAKGSVAGKFPRRTPPSNGFAADSEQYRGFPNSIVLDHVKLLGIPLLKSHEYLVMARFFLVQKNCFLPLKYGVVQLGKKVKTGRLFYRSFIISLFSFSLAMLLIEFGLGQYFNAAVSYNEIFSRNLGTLMGSMVIVSVSNMVFFPFWFLEDSGIISYRIYPNERLPVDIQGIHSIYHNILLGYAGVSVIIAWISYTSKFLSLPTPGDPIWVAVLAIMFLPLVLQGFFTIPIYLYEKYLPHMNERFLPHLDKMNFRNITIPSFEKI